MNIFFSLVYHFEAQSFNVLRSCLQTIVTITNSWKMTCVMHKDVQTDFPKLYVVT